MSNLIDEIMQADEDLSAAIDRATEASRRLRHAKAEVRDCRKVRDRTEVLTSFCARLDSRRSAARRAREAVRAIQEQQEDES